MFNYNFEMLVDIGDIVLKIVDIFDLYGNYVLGYVIAI